MSFETYPVVHGDTLTSIAWEHGLGSDWRALYELQTDDFKEHHTNPHLIREGDKLRVPPPVSYSTTRSVETKHTLPLPRSQDDLIAKSRLLHQEFLDLREISNQWVREVHDEAFVAAVARTLLSTNREHYATRVDEIALSTFEKSYAKDQEKYASAYQQKAHELVDVMRLPAWDAQLRALPLEEQQQIYSECISRLNESSMGGEFLREEFFGRRRQRGDDHRRSDARFKDVFSLTSKLSAKGIDALMAGLQAVAPVIVDRTSVKVGDLMIQRFIESRLVLAEVNVARAVYELRPAGLVPDPSFKPISIPIWRVEEKTTAVAEHVASLPTKKVLDYALKGINLSLAMKELYDNRGGKQTFGLIGATADFAQIFIKSATVAGEAGMIKLGTKTLAKETALAMVAGICDTITGVWDAVDYRARGNHPAELYSYATAAGGLLSVAGAFLVGGASTAWAGVGFVLLAIGAGVAIFGTVMVVIHDEDALQSWVYKSKFGKSTAKVGTPSEQVAEYKKLLQNTDFEISSSATTRLLKIRPGIMSAQQTKCTISIECLVPKGIIESPLETRKPEETLVYESPFHGDVTVQTAGDQVQSIVVALPERVKSQPVVYANVRMLVDVFGDGSWTYSQEKRLMRVAPF